MENNNEWLSKEKQQIDATKSTFLNADRLPALKMEPNRIYSLVVDYSKEWAEFKEEKEKDGKMQITKKKLIPVTYQDQKFIFWLNCRNPLYAELIKLGLEGKNEVKITRTGTTVDTRYSILKE